MNNKIIQLIYRCYWIGLLLGTVIFTAGCQMVEEIGYKDKVEDKEMNSTEQKSIEISEDNGKFYLNGITLGDTRDQVIELLGTDYLETNKSQEVITNKSQEMLHESMLDYGHLIVNIQNDAVNHITVPNMNEKYYEEMFNLYIEDGIVYTNGKDLNTHSGARIFYSEGHSPILLAKYNNDMKLFLYLYYPEGNFLESIESGDIKKISINE
ncbi:hypothetical protein [Ureibacillus acetophenoni]|uniref:Uncharacterized protein n=1 Tax=Ureibacillus acetophenoni TaxID=614649 RepID=A0A285UQM1_9BACL|nr:hypothetical protein [Ureibacillus acetophenoni]SOC43688.1 hypothetical protein SAMN05877842_11714 [Ureibacillus acetophenoni]